MATLHARQLKSSLDSPADLKRIVQKPNIDLNQVLDDQWGNTALHEAANNALAEAVQILLEAGADVNVKNSAGWTPLHCACSTFRLTEIQQAETVTALIKFSKGKIDPNIVTNAKSGDTLTALHVALKRNGGEGTIDVIKPILANCENVDLSLADKEGNTALELAIRLNNSAVIKLLEKYKSSKGASSAAPASSSNAGSSVGNNDKAIQLLLLLAETVASYSADKNLQGRIRELAYSLKP